MKMKLLAAAIAAMVPLAVHATDGYFAHGYGMKAKGMGGASIAVTGNGSLAASYSTSPTSSLSCSRVRSALSSSGVRVMAAAWS